MVTGQVGAMNPLEGATGAIQAAPQVPHVALQAPQVAPREALMASFQTGRGPLGPATAVAPLLLGMATSCLETEAPLGHLDSMAPLGLLTLMALSGPLTLTAPGRLLSKGAHRDLQAFTDFRIRHGVNSMALPIRRTMNSSGPPGMNSTAPRRCIDHPPETNSTRRHGTMVTMTTVTIDDRHSTVLPMAGQIRTTK